MDRFLLAFRLAWHAYKARPWAWLADLMILACIIAIVVVWLMP